MTAANANPSEIVRSLDTKGFSLRSFTARGVLINSAFDVAIGSLTLIRGLILAALLTRADYGLWGILVITLGVLSRLKLIGVSDKYVQQEESDQELAFQRAFTIELIVSAAAIVPIAAALPIAALVYGRWELVPPGLLLLTMLIADALQAPFWVYYRQMNFLRQRTLGAVEPLVGFVVAVVLAVLGAGYWSLAVGLVVGAWAGALAAMVTSPYRLAWRYHRGSVRLYASFSAPLFISTLCSIALANGTAIAANGSLGLAGVGAIALAGNLTAFTTKLDDLVSGTLYPAICAMQNRLDLLRESFVKSNRLALIWAMPFGVGFALFSGDLVRFGIGEKWRSAVVLLQISGVIAAISHVGFNWDDYFRARGDTVPVAVASVFSAAVLLGVGIPLLESDGLVGLAVGMGAGAAVHLVFRAWYLARLFEGFRFVRHAARAVLPTVPAVAAVLLARVLQTGSRTIWVALADLALYLLVAAAATWIIERDLLRESAGYVLARAARSRSDNRAAQYDRLGARDNT